MGNRGISDYSNEIVSNFRGISNTEYYDNTNDTSTDDTSTDGTDTNETKENEGIFNFILTNQPIATSGIGVGLILG